MKGLPTPSPGFTKRKDRILQQLSIPDSEYTDASPKGSIDAGIRGLIDEINRLDGFVTTSSCAGRVSVFVEGKKTVDPGPGPQPLPVQQQRDREEEELENGSGRGREFAKPDTVAGVGGKGGGGSWLFVSHDPVPLADQGSADSPDLDLLLGLRSSHDSEQLRIGDDELKGDGASGSRLIHFKFEPMVSGI